MKQIEIILRKLLLKILLLFRSREKLKILPTITKDSKLLFIRLNRIGDALVSTPLLYEIKKHFRCEINILASPKNYFIFTNPELADNVIIYNKKLKSISELIKMINEKHYDILIDLHDDVSTTVSYLVALSNCKHKIGFDKSNKKLYTHIVPKIDSSKFHIVDRIMKISDAFKLNYNASEINIKYIPKLESDNIAQSFIDKHFKENKFILGINISAGSDARFWGVQQYKDLIASLSDYNMNIILMCLEQDLRRAWEIVGHKFPIYYRPLFDEFAAMIKKLDFLVTPDTSIIHIASAFEVPTFGIYVKYNTNDQIWTPYKAPNECVVTSEPTLHSISFNSIKNKFIPFFENYYGKYKTE